jgi:hypothetical protein
VGAAGAGAAAWAGALAGAADVLGADGAAFVVQAISEASTASSASVLIPFLPTRLGTQSPGG